jgi:hypothetical protein
MKLVCENQTKVEYSMTMHWWLQKVVLKTEEVRGGGMLVHMRD